MRVASRVIVGVLALTGLIFVSLGTLLFFLFHPQSVLAESPFGRPVWTGPAMAVGLGIGLLLLGWYYFRLDVDALDAQDQPTSRFALYFLAHQRQLKVIAQVGLAISLIRFGALCFGVDWPGRWVTWPLAIAWIGLGFVAGPIARGQATDRLDWERVPERMRTVLRMAWKAVGPALWILLLLIAWGGWRRQASWLAVTNGLLVVVIFTWEALFFAYGEMRTDEKPSSGVLKT
jgi:hypothetical protein